LTLLAGSLLCQEAGQGKSFSAVNKLASPCWFKKALDLLVWLTRGHPHYAALTSSLLLLPALLVTSCSRRSSHGDDVIEPSLTIPLNDVSYLEEQTIPNWEDGWLGGLAAIGDINGDGYTDIIVAASRQKSLGGVDPGWIEAYSGKDGSLLWQASGLTRDQVKENAQAYKLGPFSVLPDLNGDGVEDLYCREGWSHETALLISGKDGQVFGHYALPSNALTWARLLCAIAQTDKTELAFFENRNRVLSLNAADLKPLGNAALILPEVTELTILSTTFDNPRGNGDHHWLVRRDVVQSNKDSPYQYELAVVSGPDRSLVRRFVTDRPRHGGRTVHACPGDLNGDGVPDLIVASSTGAGPDNSRSSLRAISSADGRTLWMIGGHELPGGREMIVVDLKTRQERSEVDVEFGSQVIGLPDLDGDGATDLATTAFIPSGNQSRRGILIISGATGRVLAKLAPRPTDGDLPDDAAHVQLARIDSVDGKGGCGVVAYIVGRGKRQLAIFNVSGLESR
jgi:hypothetical protein